MSEHLLACLMKSIYVDREGDMRDIDEELYRGLRDLAEVLGEDWRSILMVLPDHAPWVPAGGLLYRPYRWFESDNEDTWEREARLFACDCAERVLHLFEEKYPSNKRPRKAIEVARRFAVGEATEEEREEAYRWNDMAYASSASTHAADSALAAAAPNIANASRVASYRASRAVYNYWKAEMYEQWKMLVDRLCKEK